MAKVTILALIDLKVQQKTPGLLKHSVAQKKGKDIEMSKIGRRHLSHRGENKLKTSKNNLIFCHLGWAGG